MMNIYHQTFGYKFKLAIMKLLNIEKLTHGQTHDVYKHGPETQTKLLRELPQPYRDVLLSMYRGEKQKGADGVFHEIDSVTRISVSQGMWMYNFLTVEKPKHTLEIGLAYGFSTLYFLAAISKNGSGYHTAVDPFQFCMWHGIGLTHAQRLSMNTISRFTFIEERSDRAFVDFAREGRVFDFIFIDGYHRFDDVLVDFYLYAQLCSIGGFIVIDDMWMRSIQAVASFVRSNRIDFIEINTAENNICVFQRVGRNIRKSSHFVDFR